MPPFSRRLKVPVMVCPSSEMSSALLFDSPTPFSVWGVVAMWATFAAALLATLRGRLHIPPRVWRVGHTGLAVVIVVGSVVHALLVEGSMGVVSKAVFCLLVLVATAKLVADLRAWTLLARRRSAAASQSGQP